MLNAFAEILGNYSWCCRSPCRSKLAAIRLAGNLIHTVDKELGLQAYYKFAAFTYVRRAHMKIVDREKMFGTWSHDHTHQISQSDWTMFLDMIIYPCLITGALCQCIGPHIIFAIFLYSRVQLCKYWCTRCEEFFHGYSIFVQWDIEKTRQHLCKREYKDIW